MAIFVKNVIRWHLHEETESTAHFRRLCGFRIAICKINLQDHFSLANRSTYTKISLFSLHGTAITTVEGIGSTKTKLHAVQQKLADAHGSQCGFCTPGIVMSMYTLLRNNPAPKMEDIETYFQVRLLLICILSSYVIKNDTFSGQSL